MASYQEKPFKTPHDLRGKYYGAKALIIATGGSTKSLIPYKDRIRSKFDLVLGLNMATNNFEEELDYRLIVEKKAGNFVSDLNSRNYRKDLPYIINWKGIDDYPRCIPRYKTGRCNFNFKPDLRQYKIGTQEGLLIGPTDVQGLSVGSVSCQGLHLAGILGAEEAYLIGCDLIFNDQGHHYYGGNVYSNSKTKPENRSPIITIDFHGSKIQTLRFFYESAGFIDKVAEDYAKKAGMRVYDFSGGLLSKPTKLKLDEFFGEKR